MNTDKTFWNERFAGDDYAYGREPNDFVRAEAHRIARGRVLCLAEGEGRNAVFLAGLGHDVTAVDLSTEGLRKAERLATERGVKLTLIQADLAEFEPEEASYTGIVTTFCHLPPAIRQRVHQRVVRALAPGGRYLIEVYRPAQLALGTGGPKDVTLLASLDDLRRELAPLTFEVAREVERDIQEGAHHAGLSATVQVVALR